MRIARISFIAVAMLWLFSASSAACAAYPDKPIKLIIGSAPGSGPDIIARVMADRLYQTWNERIVVDSRPGAAGAISAELALQAPPDGYTWMMLTSQLLVASQVLTSVRFDLERDFLSISLIGTVPFVLVTNPAVEARTVAELIALAKKSPGALRYGSAGTGAAEHLCGVLFTSLSGTDMLHVPYKGVAQAITDTLARQVDFTYAVLPAALPHILGSRLRALGVTSPNRAPLISDVPSIAESVPGYQMLGWYSLVAPRGTPADLLDLISAEIVKAVKEPQFGDKLKNIGIDVVGSTRAELDAFRRDQTRRINELVKISGARTK